MIADFLQFSSRKDWLGLTKNERWENVVYSYTNVQLYLIVMSIAYCISGIIESLAKQFKENTEFVNLSKQSITLKLYENEEYGIADLFAYLSNNFTRSDSIPTAAMPCNLLDRIVNSYECFGDDESKENYIWLLFDRIISLIVSDINTASPVMYLIYSILHCNKSNRLFFDFLPTVFRQAHAP